MSISLRREPVRQRDIVSFGRRTPRFNFEEIRSLVAAERALELDDSTEIKSFDLDRKLRTSKSLFLEHGAAQV
ncbi:MAG: hypothetical protein K1X79_11225 [Oligoflexia bacterium]|nr:hypothetical protein [Oligoflexia bacterium]